MAMNIILVITPAYHVLVTTAKPYLEKITLLEPTFNQWLACVITYSYSYFHSHLAVMLFLQFLHLYDDLMC
jgi:hypothetical protein